MMKAIRHLVLLLLLFLSVSAGISKPGDPELTTSGEHMQQFEDHLVALFNDLCLADAALDYKAFRYALIGYYNLRTAGRLSNTNIITIIDFNKSSKEERFFVVDLARKEVLYKSLVAHGIKSGGEYATRFSNKVGSNQSSLGFYVTGETYMGRNGYSLTLDGMERGINDKIRERYVVIHKADYVSETFLKHNGSLGHSEGCPAIPESIYKEVIDLIKNGSCVFAYHQSPEYLLNSALINYTHAIESYFTAVANTF